MTMRLKSSSIFLASYLMLLSACNAGGSTSPSATADLPVPTASAGIAKAATALSAATLAQKNKMDSGSTAQSPPVAAKSLNGINKGMAYADFRKAVLAQGWQPVVDLKCKANVVGGAYKELCAKGADSCKACDELPELSACSGDAVCAMNFHHAADNQSMEVSTYGDIGDRNVHGKDSQLDVTGWTVSPGASH